MSYIDGFLVPVPLENKDAYKASVEKVWPVMKEMGALALNEYWGDDVPEGEVTSFPLAVKCAPGETVVFAWVEWPDKATRDAANAKMMEDPRFGEMMMSAPFDAKRMIYGGFEALMRA